MRKLVILLTVILAISGVSLILARQSELPPEWLKGISLLHTWGGNFFLVVFPLYAWDHISGNRRWLRRVSLVSISGVVQTATAVLLILTGALLLLYGGEIWPNLRALHHWLTYVLAAALIVHKIVRKIY